MGNGETNTPATLPDKPTPNAEEQTLQLDILAHHHHHHPSPSLVLSSPKGTPGPGDDDDDQHQHIDDGDGRGGGPNQNDSGGNKLEQSTSSTRPPMTFTNSPCILYKDDVAVTGGLAAAPVRAFQPFDVSITNSVASKSPAAALGFPFTPVQWKELERQAMIYKYMIASVPVPHQLLLPIPPRNFPADPTFPWNDKGPLVYNLRYAASTNKDLEPGRCKRTDGKKWRCSRDVAPHQKYCERHMHRGRPRSRKPVELHSSVDTTTTTTANNKKSRLQTTPTMHTTAVGEPNKYSSSPRFLGTNSCGDHQPKEALFLNAPSSFPSPTNYNQPSRVFSWSMEGEVVSQNAVKQQWLHLMDVKRGLGATDDSILFNTNSCGLEQGYGEEPLNLFSYSNDFAPGNIQNNHNRDQCHVFLDNSDLISSEHPRLEQHGNLTRGFIDAWSNGDLKTMEESSTVASPEGNLCPDTLTLSMALDEGMELATPVSNPEHKAKCGPVPWLPFNSGGPLAEVLRPSNCIPIGSNPASPYTGNGDSISPPATSVSSPTGILHRALFSHSDSSVRNSPTVAATPDLVAFQWLN